jgi:transcriptional regulator with XRE-family HTH domain
MTPGQLLREARRRHGVTQTQLATRSRTSQAAISRIERGLVSPGVGTLGSLLAMLNERLVVAVEPIDWGHDRSLLRENLSFTPEQRIERQAAWSRGMRRIQRAARG